MLGVVQLLLQRRFKRINFKRVNLDFTPAESSCNGYFNRLISDYKTRDLGTVTSEGALFNALN
jgi:hypothetical protein